MGRLRHLIAAPATPLTHAEWAGRHRTVLVLLAVQAAVVAAWALAAGLPPLHAGLDVLPALLALLAARSSRLPRLARSCAATLGLFAVSAAVVHLAGGASAAHFHYFVMLIVLARYEDARPFALGVAAVVLQHALLGAIPWAEALVHGAFVLAAAFALVVNWRTTEALRRAEARARRAAHQVLEVAGSILVALGPDGRVRDANPHAEAVAGRPLEGLDWFEDVVAPPAGAAARAVFDDQLAGRVPDGQDLECDVVVAGGRRRHVTLHVALTRDDHGAVNGVLLAGQDVTAQREAQRLLAAERDDLALLRRISREVVASADPRGPLVRGTAELLDGGVVVLLEQAGGDALEITAVHGAARLVGRRITEGDGPSGALLTARAGRARFVPDVAEAEAPLSPEITGALRTRSAAFRPVLVEGRPAGVLAVCWPHPLDALDDRRDSLLELMADEAAVALGRLARRSRLEAAALTDPLTGVANRRAWDDALPRELARARRSGRPFSLAMLDLNDFKSLNDRKGHQAGDAALRAAVAAWGGALRATDVLARLGGDEFGVLLPDCPADEALAVAGRLREATPHRPGAGVGTATWDGVEDAAALVRRADAALYADKSAAGAPRHADALPGG